MTPPAPGAPPDEIPDLILASASPRRRELLERMGLVPRVEPVDIDETPNAGEGAADLAARLASAKCAALLVRLGEAPRHLSVLAADTVVTLDGVCLGKPSDEAEARAMLTRLAGRRHEVVTAYRIEPPAGAGLSRTVTTSVSVRLVEPREVDFYVSSGEWRGKAGGYALQGMAAAFVTELRGSYTNVIGLPLAEVLADLRALGALLRYPRPGSGRPA